MGLCKICDRCGKKIEQGKVCEECKTKHNKLYDTQERNKDTIKFYKGKEWGRLSEVIRANQPLDLYQLYKYNRLVPAVLVHHIIPLEDDYNKRLDVDNLIGLSIESHNEIHSIYSKGQREKIKLQRELMRMKEKGPGGG